MTTRDQKVETPKGLTLMELRIRGSNQSPGRTKIHVTPAVNSMVAHVDWAQYAIMDVVKWDIG